VQKAVPMTSTSRHVLTPVLISCLRKDPLDLQREGSEGQGINDASRVGSEKRSPVQ
jgi:hypothetical protein